MKKFISVIMTLALILNCFGVLSVSAAESESTWDGTTIASTFSVGDGSQESPYLITNGAELAYLSSLVNSGESERGKYFKLVDSINLGSYSWTPIGNGDSHRFQGCFDGNNLRIDGLKIENRENIEGDSSVYYGLFGNALGAVIENLTVQGEIISHSISQKNVFVGGIVGYNRVGTVQNCVSHVYVIY